MRISDWSSDVCSSDLERHLVDHRAAAVPRRHRLEDVAPRPEDADAGRPVKLVTGEDVEVAADGGDIDRHARHRLAAVEQKLRANAMGQIGGAAGGEAGAEDVGEVGEEIGRW